MQEIQEILADSHSQLVELVAGFSDEEMFTKKCFLGTRTTSLGSYLVSAAPSHYGWAVKKLCAHLTAADRTHKVR